jgi:hypothetical protein
MSGGRVTARDTAQVVPRKVATVLVLAVLALSGCSSEKDPEPTTPSPQDSPSAAVS